MSQLAQAEAELETATTTADHAREAERLSVAAREDAIDDALDYARAAERVAALTREGKFQLAETLAEHIAALLLREFPIQRVRVEVEKPEAVAEADSVGVSIERRQAPGA